MFDPNIYDKCQPHRVPIGVACVAFGLLYGAAAVAFMVATRDVPKGSCCLPKACIADRLAPTSEIEFNSDGICVLSDSTAAELGCAAAAETPAKCTMDNSGICSQGTGLQAVKGAGILGVILGALLVLLPVPFCVAHDGRRWMFGLLWCVAPVSLAEIVVAGLVFHRVVRQSVYNWDTDPKDCTLDVADVCVQYSYPEWKRSSCPYTGRTSVLSWALFGASVKGFCLSCVLRKLLCGCCYWLVRRFWPTQGAPPQSDVTTM